MKAIVYNKYGGPEVLEYVDLPEPLLGHNSLLIDIKAAALNPADIQIQRGVLETMQDAWFPVIPGWDVAGVVRQVGVGVDVSEFKPGDEVLGYIRQEILHHGGYAEVVSLPADLFVRKPKNMSWEEAAGLPLAALTAHRAIITILDLKKGETLLIHGASGGVGCMAAQIATHLGARVIGSASTANHDYLRSISVEPIDYRADVVSQIRALAPQGVDAVLDCIGKGVLDTTPQVGREGVRAATVADFRPDATSVFVRADQPTLQSLADMVEAGDLVVPVAATFPLARTADAQRVMQATGGAPQASHGPGKIVLMMG